MRKEAVIFAFVLLISAFFISGIYADEASQVNDAYVCLEHQIGNETCQDLTTEEKIFSLLAVGECKDELINSSITNDKCWSKVKGQSVCDIETTAKAVLALDSIGANTTLQEEWLLNQVGISTDLEWFLQVDNSGGGDQEMDCSVLVPRQGTTFNPYDEYSFKIGEDKKITSNAGSCLIRANNNYWFRITESCYDRTFQISCNKDFITTLVYKEKTSSTYHISDEVHSASSGADTTEQINSFCFKSGSSCNYLGTLWATVALDRLDVSISNFLPYLTTLASSNENTFPYPFLYILTDKLDYKSKILSKQKHIFDQYFWEIAGGRGKYYDTALALLPFQGETLSEKDNSKDWLLAYQGSNGCWDNGNILSNAFILYSIWPRGGIGFGISCSEAGFNCIGTGDFCGGMIRNEFGCSGGTVCCDPTPIDDDETCSEQGNICVNNSASCSGTTTNGLCSDSKICCDLGSGGDETECELEGFTCGFGSQCSSAGGTLLPQFQCDRALKCCDTEPIETFCSDSNGIICSNTEFCSGGNTLYTDDLNYGEVCCVEPGNCEIKTSDFSCEDNLGYCSSSCGSGYEENNGFTCSGTQVCCTKSSSSSGGSYWWIWVLFALVILVVVGILYRDKIKEYIDKSRARSSGLRPSPRGGFPPSFPPSYSRSPKIGSPVPRKMVPETPRPVHRPLPKKTPEELDAVLKKLKEIGK